MSSPDHPRYIGVARPPSGVDPDPPRLVVDLSHPRPSRSRAIGSAKPVDPARPPGYSLLAGHRRRLRQAVVRRWEFTVWFVAATVAAGVVVVLLGDVPREQAVLSGRDQSVAVGSGIPGPVVATNGPVDCFLHPCDDPTYDGPPTRLRIPRLAVSTTLESLVLDPARQLEPPRDYGQAGWWTQGVAPGDVGAAVIAGHVDSAASGPAVFYNLHTLVAGDRVEVDRGGQIIVFTVTDVEQYPKNAFPTGRVYQPTPDAELRLITCGGEFDRSRLSYRDNIVVYAVLSHA